MRSLLSILCLTFATVASGSAFASKPACWKTPRTQYAEASAEDVARVRIRRVASEGEVAGEPSPDGSAQLAFTAPVATATSAMASMSVGGEDIPGLLVMFSGARYMHPPAWVNDRLVHFRFFYTRLMGVDGLIDITTGELVWVRSLTDGTLAMQQAQASCELEAHRDTEACRC